MGGSFHHLVLENDLQFFSRIREPGYDTFTFLASRPVDALCPEVGGSVSPRGDFSL